MKLFKDVFFQNQKKQHKKPSYAIPEETGHLKIKFPNTHSGTGGIYQRVGKIFTKH